MHKSFRSFAPLLYVLAVLIIFPLSVYADDDGEYASFAPRVFTRGSFVYLVTPTRVVFLSMDTRSSHALYAAADPVFNITDVVRNGDMIWAANGAGAVMGVNMQTGTVEEYGRSRVSPGGKIDTDGRYLWLAVQDTLFRMDMSSREWVKIPVPESDGDVVRAVVSYGDKIHIITQDLVRVYRLQSDDWTVIPHRYFSLPAGEFYRIGNVCYFTHGKTLFRYDPSKVQWNNSSIREDIRAADLTDDYMVVAGENRTYGYNGRTLTIEPHPQAPMMRGIRSVTYHHGRVAAVTPKGLAFFSHPVDFDLIRYPDYIKPADDAFVFSYYDHVIVYSNDNFVLHHVNRRLWSTVRIVRRNADHDGKNTWDEDGARGVITEDHNYKLNGTATLRQQPGFTRTESEGLVKDYGTTLVNGTATMHVTDADGRILDLTLDNAITTLPPQKGLYYKGMDYDIFDRAQVGVQGSGMTPGRVTPNVAAEGASAVFSGTETAPGRDRAVVSGAAGGGFVLSKTEWRSHGYDRGGSYYIDIGRGEIDPKSVRVYVDGVALSGSDFSYDPSRRRVQILRRDKTDPTSVIQIGFSVIERPDDPYKFEPLPENHHGQYGFAEGTISPRQWMSARAGILAQDGSASGATIYAGAPVEWRSKDGGRSVLLDPEVAYDAKMGTHAAAVALGARENRAFGSYKGYFAARDYAGIDRYTFENNRVGSEHEIDFGYDIRDDLRTVWRQSHRSIDGYDRSHFELRTNYTGDRLPDIEVSAYSYLIDGNIDDWRLRKEAFSLRLIDMASSDMAENLGAHNAGYELALTEYKASGGRSGRVLYGMATVSPIEKITITGSGTYHDNPFADWVVNEVNPKLSVRLRDLPRGLDMEADYDATLFDNSNNTHWLGGWKSFSAFFYPGEYISALSRFAIYAAYHDHTESATDGDWSGIKQSFLPNFDSLYSKDVRETAGVLWFPIDNLLLSTVNIRERGLHNDWLAYISRERAKWWFESGNSIEGTLEITKSEIPLLRLHGDLFYEHRFNETLTLGAGGFGVRHSEHGNVYLHGGPKFAAALTKNLDGFIRTIENSHWLLVNVNNEERTKPDIHYSMYIRMKMPPNLSLVGELNIESYRTRSIAGGGGIYLHAGF